jgi:hypothetical protein
MQFKSVDHAVSWAFRICGVPILKGSSIFSMMPSGGNPSNLNAHDKHAQAALILGMIDRLADQNQKAWIVAQYGKAFNTRDWGIKNDRVTDEQKAAMETAKAVEDQLVTAVLAAMPTGVHSRRGFSKLIRNYFGAGIGVNAIRADLRCEHKAIPEWKDRVYTALDRIADNIEVVLEAEMVRQGLIVMEVAA